MAKFGSRAHLRKAKASRTKAMAEGRFGRPPKLTSAQTSRMVALRHKGYSLCRIAERYRVSVSTVSRYTKEAFREDAAS